MIYIQSNRDWIPKKDQAITTLNFKYDLKKNIITREKVGIHPSLAPARDYLTVDKLLLFITNSLNKFNLLLKEGLHYI